MKAIFTLANRYVEESDWKDLALLKFCLWAMGMLMVMMVPPKNRKAVAWGCTGVFLVTYIPLMAKFYRVAKEIREDHE